MHNFAPTVCRDNFFEDPHKIIELSKQIDFKPTKYISGYRSDYLDKIDIDLYKYVNTRLLSVFYPTANNIQFSSHTYFQKSVPDACDGWVHQDTKMLTAIIYLTPGGTSGTSLFNIKKEFLMPDWSVDNRVLKHEYFKNKDKYSEKEKEIILQQKLKHNNHFEKTVNFEGVFNRMICFDSKQYHAAEVCDKERLIIISFIDNLRQSDIK